MNLIAYTIYLFITYFVTVHVGRTFYRNGYLYILGLLNGNVRLAGFVNRVLLVGYYLLNLGYATLMISTWKTISTWLQLVTSVALMTGRILLGLGIIHCFNMALIWWLSRRTITHQKI